MFFAASRGVFLAWIFGVLITFIVYKKTAVPFLRLQAMHFILGFFIYKLLFQIIPTIGQQEVVTGNVLRETTSDRINLWHLSLNMIQNHPFFGAGPMSFAWLYSGESAHPHNSVLQIMSEWGLPAALVILSLAVYGLLFWLKRFNSSTLENSTDLNKNLAIILFFTLCTNAAYSFVDGVIVMPISQVMMFTFIGLAIGFYREGHLTDIKHNYIFEAAFACAVLATLVWSTLPEITQGASGSEKHFSIGYISTGPRVWLEIK